MISEQEGDHFKVTLVDFGLVTKYIKKGEHITENEKCDCFRGSVMYADIEKLNFLATSRKHDILSLFNMFVCMLNGGKLYGKSTLITRILESQNDPAKYLINMKEYRKKYGIKIIIKAVF